MISIAVDTMGGDHGPADFVDAVAAASINLNVEFLLVGHERTLTALLSEREHNPERIAVYHAPDAVGQYEDAGRAVAAKPDASIAIAARLVREGLAQTLVTAGNPRAILLTADRSFARIAGVGNVALASVFPTETRRGEKEDPFSLILDTGAAPRATAHDLVAYAVMGGAYASVVSRNLRPRVGLLSNGTEEEAELTPEIREASAALREHPGVHYIGPIDAMDIPRGTADIVVCSGFTGSIATKLLEGVHETVLSLARYAYKERAMKRAALVMLQGGVSQLKQLTDWEQYGGAPILGFEYPIIRAHGRSHARALHNAIKIAAKVAGSDLIARIRTGLAACPPDAGDGASS